MYECVGFRKRELPDIIAHFSKDEEKTKKKSTAHVKQSLHGVTDSKTDRYLFSVITRTNDLWETVKPINVAVKIKTELFAPKSNPIVKVRTASNTSGTPSRAAISSVLLVSKSLFFPSWQNIYNQVNQFKLDLTSCKVFSLLLM